MTLRNGKVLCARRDSGDNDDSAGEEAELMFPIVTKTSGQQQYVPWSFCDMIGLAGRLPDLAEGANKWTTALEESTAGVTLTGGDIKALLMHIIGKHTIEEILQDANLGADNNHANANAPTIHVHVNQPEPITNHPGGQPGFRKGPYCLPAWSGRPLQQGDRSQSTPHLNPDWLNPVGDVDRRATSVKTV